LSVVALGLLLAFPAAALGNSADYEYGHKLIEQYVSQIVMQSIPQLFGEELNGPGCLTTDQISLCIDPRTPPEKWDELLRRLPTWTGEGGDRYTIQGRWSQTATDGNTGILGDPIHLTYSFLPDGTFIPSGAGEPSGPSVLYAEMNSQFGDPSVWKPLFAEHFALWSIQIGVHYTEVTDDGANFPNSIGVLGSRGDVRIGCHNIDGYYGILAYDYYPNGGDMVLDSSENWAAPANDYRFFRNVVSHEHGHALGLAHVEPLSCTKLMEANLCTNFLGPQDDDFRGGHRNYGDYLEDNDNGAEATELGTFTGDLTLATESINATADTDWYHFTVNNGAQLDVTVHPVGTTYQVDGVIVHTHQVVDMQFDIRNGANGGTILTTVNNVIEGLDEVLTDYALSPGEYWIKVYRFAGSNNVQRYNMILNLTITDETDVADAAAPAGGLGLSVYPNPFNPKTSVRLYAPAPGDVTLDVYTVAGAMVRTIQARAEAAGWMQVTWNGRDDAGHAAPSGIYFIRAQAGEQSETVRAVLLK
jgi:hypothetical protein